MVRERLERSRNDGSLVTKQKHSNNAFSRASSHEHADVSPFIPVSRYTYRHSACEHAAPHLHLADARPQDQQVISLSTPAT